MHLDPLAVMFSCTIFYLPYFRRKENLGVLCLCAVLCTCLHAYFSFSLSEKYWTKWHYFVKIYVDIVSLVRDGS